jgi:hypothetical protein
MKSNPQVSQAVFGRLNDLHVSRRERLRINAYIHDGEVIADFSSRAFAGVRSGVDALARDIKAAFAKPARH